jgi:hypothetical protein
MNNSSLRALTKSTLENDESQGPVDRSHQSWLSWLWCATTSGLLSFLDTELPACQHHEQDCVSFDNCCCRPVLSFLSPLPRFSTTTHGRCSIPLSNRFPLDLIVSVAVLADLSVSTAREAHHDATDARSSFMYSSGTRN